MAVYFSYRSTKKSNTDRNNDNCHKNETYHECVKKVKNRPNLKGIDINKYDNDDGNGKDDKKACEKYAQMKKNYKKPIQFIQYTYIKEIDDDDNTSAQFGL